MVALMPFVFARRLIERIVAFDAQRPFRWIWERLLMPPLRALAQLALLPWQGLVWLANALRRPFEALARWCRAVASSVARILNDVGRALGRALTWIMDVILAPIRWMGHGLSWLGEAVWSGIRWMGRGVAAAVTAVWELIVRAWSAVLGIAAQTADLLLRPLRWAWAHVLSALAIAWGGLSRAATWILGGIGRIADAIGSAVHWCAARIGGVIAGLGTGLRRAVDAVAAALTWSGRMLLRPVAFAWRWLVRWLSLTGRALSSIGRWLWSWLRRLARALARPFVASYRWIRRTLKAFRQSSAWSQARRIALSPVRGTRSLLVRARRRLSASGVRLRAATTRARERTRLAGERARAVARRATGRR